MVKYCSAACLLVSNAGNVLPSYFEVALFKQPPLEEDIVPILLYECHRLYHDGITIQVLWKKSFACMKRHCGTPAATTE